MGSSDRTTRRRLVSTVATACAAGALSGCVGSFPPESGDPTVEDAEWNRRTEGDADAAVREDGARVDLRVNRCSRARAVAGFGSLSGDLSLSFEYVTRAKQWWERPFVAVAVDAETVYDSREDPNRGVGVDRAAETAGSFVTTVAVDGVTDVAFGIEPSDHCDNPDHGDTFFEVRSFEVDLE